MIRVLVVDDSRAFRIILRRTLETAPASEIVVCGEAADPFEAREQIVALRPDVVTLDVNMPRMDGEQFLQRLMQVYPLPVVVITSEASDPVRVAALRAAGAYAVVAKPMANAKEAFQRELAETVRTAAGGRARRATAQVVLDDVIAIGASTGGSGATARLLAGMSAATPPIVIAQHIDPNLAGSYVSWLGRGAPMRVREARDGDPLEPGVAFLPPQDRHLRVVRNHERLHVVLGTGDKVNGHRPSIDVLFSSLAALDRVRVAAALLTGMGSDGAQGLLELRKKGARTFAQEPGDCIVASMPENAIRLGAAQRVMPAAQMGYWLTSA